MKHAAGPRKNISKKAQTVIIEISKVGFYIFKEQLGKVHFCQVEKYSPEIKAKQYQKKNEPKKSILKRGEVGKRFSLQNLSEGDLEIASFLNKWENMKGKTEEIKEFLMKYDPVELTHLYELHAVDQSFLSNLISYFMKENFLPNDVIVKYLVNLKKINRFKTVLDKLPEDDKKS